MIENQKRKNARIQKNIQIKISDSYKDFSKSLPLSCFSNDLSIDGIKLEVNNHYNTGDIVFIRFFVKENSIIDIKGKVQWQKEKIPDKLFLIGIRFEEIEKSNYKILEDSLYKN